MVKYEINIYERKSDGEYQLCYGWDKIDDITDLWTCIGWYMNLSNEAVNISYLEYYNEALDNIAYYINKVIHNNGIVARANDDKVLFKIEESKRG